MKEKVFYQLTDFDCGLASLKSMLYYYSKGKNLILNEDLTHKEYSLFDLKQIALSQGMVCEGYKVDNLDLTKMEPCLLLLKRDNKKHFVFFIRQKGQEVYFIDPSYGKISLPSSAFKDMFLGYILKYESIEIAKKKKVRVNKNTIFDIFLEFIMSIPFYLFIFFFILQKSIPLLVLLLMLVSYFAKRIILLIRMQRFDHKLEKKFANKVINESIIKKLYDYKKAKFSFIPTIYNFILYNFSFFLFTLLIEKGYILTIVYFSYLMFQLYSLKNDIKHIYLLGEISTSKTNFQKKYQRLNYFTNLFVQKKEIIRICISFILLIIIALLNQALWKNNGIMLSLSLFTFFLINKDDMLTLYMMNKDQEVGETIYCNLGLGD